MDGPGAQAPVWAEALAAPAPAPEDHAMAALAPRMLLWQMVSGGVAPLVAYELARTAGLADATSLALSAAPPAIAIVGEWAWRRRLNVIGVIVLIGIVLGLGALAFLHGDELVLKMRDSVVTGAFGAICLVTLVLPVRPAMFYVGRALASAGDRSRRQEFDGLWEFPRARRTFTLLTLGWGAGLVLEAGLRALLAFELSTGRFLAVTPVVNWIVIGALLYWTITYTRSSRRRGEAEAEAEARALSDQEQGDERPYLLPPR